MVVAFIYLRAHFIVAHLVDDVAYRWIPGQQQLAIHQSTSSEGEEKIIAGHQYILSVFLVHVHVWYEHYVLTSRSKGAKSVSIILRHTYRIEML